MKHMNEQKTIQIKSYIIKYLLIVIGLAVIRVLLSELKPELFTKTIEGDGFTQSKTTFFAIYQLNFFNIILALIMAVDLKKHGTNWILIPVLTVISTIAGVFFFSILILTNFMNRYEQI